MQISANDYYEVSPPKIPELSELYNQLKTDFEKICRRIDESYAENKTPINPDKNRFEGVFQEAASVFSFPHTNNPRKESNAVSEGIIVYKRNESESSEHDKIFPLLKINKIARELIEEMKTHIIKEKYKNLAFNKNCATYTI